MAKDDREDGGTPGIGVDARGRPVVDPTKNVENLVKALQETLRESRAGDQRFLDAQFNWAERMQNFARDAEARLRDQLRVADERHAAQVQMANEKLSAAETRRIDQLATTSDRFETTIRNMLAESVRTTSDLVSNQLVQIQATFNERVSKLEAGAFTQAGKSSVADPALSDALARMTAALTALQTTGNRTEGEKQTFSMMGAMTLGAVSAGALFIAIATLLYNIFTHH